MNRVDPDEQAYRVRLATEGQRHVVGGLSDDRLRVVRARLLSDQYPDSPEVRARLEVVQAELERRGIK